jgi:hypothetical protein
MSYTVAVGTAMSLLGSTGKNQTMSSLFQKRSPLKSCTKQTTLNSNLQIICFCIKIDFASINLYHVRFQASAMAWLSEGLTCIIRNQNLVK